MPRKTDRRDYGVAAGLLFFHVGALLAFVPAFFSWSAVVVAFSLYFVTVYGISLGYHRILTHKGATTAKWFEHAVVTLGSLALQGGPIEWVAQHRAHHANADTASDPHSAAESMRWAHFDWMFRHNEARVLRDDRERLTPDLHVDGYYVWLDRHSMVPTLVLAVILGLVGGLPFLVWGMFVRLVFAYHCTWLVNSAAHGWGYRSYRTGDRSTNNWFVAALTFGEGWHNNHHAFPFSIRHGLGKFEYDPTWWSVLVFRRLGLMRDLRIATPEILERARRREAA